MPTITFLPSGVTIDVKPGTTVFQAAARAEVPIASQCGGKCACALCRVKVVEGSLISPMTWEEEGHMGNAFFITKQRLSCQLQVFGDVTIEVAEPETREKPKSRYIPHALMRKREQMEREADVANATGQRRPGRRPSGPAKGGQGAEPSTDGPNQRPNRPPRSGGPPKRDGDRPARRRRRKPRNPGAARSGDSRPPAGAKKKKE